jgi:exodeoxyribonuclease VII large subunit
MRRERLQRVDQYAARLEGVNPQAVLERGYSIVTVHNRSIRSVADVNSGDVLDIRVADGTIKSFVKDKSGVSL